MSQALTDTGLNLPERYTEEQFFEAGRFLAKIEHGMQWAIGDWYNAIPWGDKEAACEKAGLNFKGAERYGDVCDSFPKSRRVAGIGFTHHKVLAIEALTPEQRQELLRQAEEGTEGKPWSSARLKKERDHVLGIEPPALPAPIQDSMDQILEELPKSVTKKTKAHIRKVLDHMKRSFHDEVRRKVAGEVKERRQRLTEMEKKAEEEFKNAIKIKAGAKSFMTEEEFKMVRSCLHPDRVPEGMEARYAKAFDIVNRLADGVW